MPEIIKLSKTDKTSFERSINLNIDIGNMRIITWLHEEYAVPLPFDTFNVAIKNNNVELANYAKDNMAFPIKCENDEHATMSILLDIYEVREKNKAFLESSLPDVSTVLDENEPDDDMLKLLLARYK
jgi:hypothetical protein